MIEHQKPSSVNTRCYQYSSTQINLPYDLKEKVIRWGERNIKNSDLYMKKEEEPPSKRGRELECHITILYGIQEISPKPIISLFKTTKPFSIELGKTSLFKTNKYFDVVKIEAYSSKLQELNSLVRKNVKTVQLFPDYKPHITVAFVKKGKCDCLEGQTIFLNNSFIAREIQFSNYLGEKTMIKLN